MTHICNFRMVPKGLNVGGNSKTGTNKRELILVLESDLYLVPFPVLRSASENSEFLCERFSLLVVPNVSSLKSGRTRKHDTDQTVPTYFLLSL